MKGRRIKKKFSIVACNYLKFLKRGVLPDLFKSFLRVTVYGFLMYHPLKEYVLHGNILVNDDICSVCFMSGRM